jgi:hypothetical protein
MPAPATEPPRASSATQSGETAASAKPGGPISTKAAARLPATGPSACSAQAHTSRPSHGVSPAHSAPTASSPGSARAPQREASQ